MGAVTAILLVLAAGVDASRTDFGVREVGHSTAPAAPQSGSTDPADRPLLQGSPRGLQEAAAFGSRWGRVTSTWRSREHNRRVGGVSNSYHLRGRAIDIARRRHVSHAEIEQALRRNGYHLVESLDEGDHSHFAFAFSGPPGSASRAAKRPTGQSGGTSWRIVSAPR